MDCFEDGLAVQPPPTLKNNFLVDGILQTRRPPHRRHPQTRPPTARDYSIINAIGRYHDGTLNIKSIEGTLCGILSLNGL